MLEVTHHNQTYVSTARLRACWSRWAHIMHVNRNQMKACRMVVQCYRKILRTALYTWRRQSDYHHTTLQVRRLAMANLLQMARMHCWNRFYVWKSAVQQMRSVEEHVDKLGLVLKRLRVIRRKRRAWGAWKTLFAKLNSPVASTGVTLRVCGPKYINAITRAQYWSSTLMRSVLVNTTLEPVLALALEALHSVLPEYAPSLYYLEQDQEYLWGHSLPVQAQHRGSASPTALDSMASSLRKLQLSRRYSPVPHDAHPEGTRQYFPVTLSDEQTPFRMRSPVFSQPGMSSHRTPFSKFPPPPQRVVQCLSVILRRLLKFRSCADQCTNVSGVHLRGPARRGHRPARGGPRGSVRSAARGAGVPPGEGVGWHAHADPHLLQHEHPCAGALVQRQR